MEHEDVYKQARKLIDEREIDEENLDTAYDLLEEITESDPDCGWAFGLISEIYYWTGETADEDEKLFNFEKGIEWGKAGTETEPDSLEANFWLAANYGSFGQVKGIMQSLFLVKPIKQTAEICLKQDETYFYGGPWRILGRLYDKAPGFPLSIGDSKKARECFEKAIEFGPKFYLNRLFFAEHLASNRDKDGAREQLQWVIDAPLNKNHEIEDGLYKEDAERMLRKL